MANHVNTFVQFDKLSDAGAAKLQELYSRVRTGENYELFSDIFGLDHEITNKYDWNIENVGPKWCYFENRAETFFATTSAWSPPENGLIWLFDQISQVDPDFVASVFYEDEMPNFFGIHVYNKDGIVDGCEWEGDEITEMMKESFPELAALNEEEQSEQYWEIWSNNIWDLVHDKQQEVYRNVMESLE